MTASGQDGRPAEQAPGARSTTAGKVMLVGAIGVLLYVAHAAFIPVFLALLFALVLSGPVEWLHARRVPRKVSALAILVLVLSGFVAIGSLVWQPAQDWFAKAPQTMALIRHKVNPVARAINHLDDIRKSAGSIGAPAGGKPLAAPTVVAPSTSAPAFILDVGASAMASVLTFVMVTAFLLAGGAPMLARMAAAVVEDWKASAVQEMLEKVRAELSHYYLVTSLINLGLGVVTGLAMWAWGMPTPYLWGALAAVLNYIPYVGAGTTLLAISLVAVMSFDTLNQVVGVAGTFAAFVTIEGQIVQPLLVGRRLEVNPLLIFLGLWFGGLFWGVAGIILATPALVALKVVAENTSSGKPLMEFLGPNDQSPGRDVKIKRIVRRLERR